MQKFCLWQFINLNPILGWVFIVYGEKLWYGQQQDAPINRLPGITTQIKHLLFQLLMWSFPLCQYIPPSLSQVDVCCLKSISDWLIGKQQLQILFYFLRHQAASQSKSQVNCFFWTMFSFFLKKKPLIQTWPCTNGKVLFIYDREYNGRHLMEH